MFRSGCERIGIHVGIGENLVSGSAQARGYPAAMGFRPGVVNSLPADGDVSLAGLAAASSRTCGAGVDAVFDAIDPQWTLVLYLLRSAAARSGPDRNHRAVACNRCHSHEVFGTFRLSVLADDTLSRLGNVRFLSEPRNLAPE